MFFRFTTFKIFKDKEPELIKMLDEMITVIREETLASDLKIFKMHGEGNELKYRTVVIYKDAETAEKGLAAGAELYGPLIKAEIIDNESFPLRENSEAGSVIWPIF